MTSKFALSLTHTALDGLLAISLLLVLIALFTPAWRLVAFVGHSSSGTVVDGTVSFGVTMSTCGGSFSSSQGCLKWNRNWPPFTIATVVMLSFCSFTLIVGLIWSITSRLLCWYRRCVLWPLPVLSGIASVFCLIGLVVFGVKSNEAADLLTSIMLSGSGQMSVTNSVGYSMVLGILATIAMTAASVFALRLTIASNNVNPI